MKKIILTILLSLNISCMNLDFFLSPLYKLSEEKREAKIESLYNSLSEKYYILLEDEIKDTEFFKNYESYDLWEMHEGIHLYSLSERIKCLANKSQLLVNFNNNEIYKSKKSFSLVFPEKLVINLGFICNKHQIIPIPKTKKKE